MVIKSRSVRTIGSTMLPYMWATYDKRGDNELGGYRVLYDLI